MWKRFRTRLGRLRARIGRWIEAALGGTHHYYSCYLPPAIGRTADFIFRLFYAGITLRDEERNTLRSLPDDAVVVYVAKYKSLFEYLFYHYRYKEDGLRIPVVGFDYNTLLLQPVSRISRMLLAHIDHFYHHLSLPDPYESGYLREELVSGHAGFLSLVEKKGFRRRFVESYTDPVRYLIETQQRIERPIYIVPQLMFFGRTPHRSVPSIIDILFGTEERPGAVRRFVTLVRNPGKIFVEISDPFDLKAFLEKPENQHQSVENLALALRRRLLVQLNRHRQSITGPLLKSREELKENILTGKRLREFMEHYAESREIPRYKVHKEADGYLDEIAARYNLPMIGIFSATVKWLINAMFEGYTVNMEGLNQVKRMSQRGPVVLIPCHKSHIDYLILSFVLYHNNMPCPHIAAGKNLSFWPLGPLFRSGGAFFIRRTFRGAVLYAKVFSEYVYKLLEEGFNIEFFIEGGRSRTGKLIQPKFGLLSILINAFREGAGKDLIFAPVYIGYDRVLEESAYLHELEGGQKKPENLWQVIRARKFLKKRYGKIYIQFHEPFSLKDYLDAQGTPIEEMTSKEQNGLVRYLGYRFINAIDHVTVITPHAIVAGAILNCAKQRFTYDHLMADVETYVNHLFLLEAKLADTLLIDYSHAIAYVFETYTHRKFLERIPPQKGVEKSQDLYRINEARRPVLDYYKNNGIVYFIPAAFTAMAILEKDAFQFSTEELFDSYTFLRGFFNNEFAYDVDQSSEFFIRRTIKIFMADAILMPHPELRDTYNLTSAGYRKLKLFASFLKTYFESYWIVLNVFMRYPKNFLDSKNRTKKITSMGNRMYKRREVERVESLSLLNYKNAVDYYTSHGIRGSEDSEAIDRYAKAIRRYLNRIGP